MLKRFANKYLSLFANNFANNLIFYMVNYMKSGAFCPAFLFYESLFSWVAVFVVGFLNFSQISAISSCISGVTWLYVSIVIWKVECPKRYCTFLGCTPALSSSVA